MVWWIGTVALAAPEATSSAADIATSPGCEFPDVWATVPADGAVDVPTDVVLTLFVGPTHTTCGVSAFAEDPLGGSVQGTVEVLDDLVRVRFDGLEPDRTYEAVVQFVAGAHVTSFTTTSEKPPGPLPPTAADVVAAPFCGTTLEIHASADADLDPATVGVLALAVAGDGVEIEVAHAPASGHTVLEGVAAGVRDACATLRLYDVAGQLAWESAADCVGEVDCPVPDPLAEVDVDFERTCEGSEVTLAIALADLPGTPADAGGTLFAELTTERGTVRSGAVGWSPGATVELPVSGSGTEDACLTLTYVDVWGAPIWTTDPVCAPADDGCPWEDDLDGVSGCGCAGAPGGGGATGALLLAALALSARRLPSSADRRPGSRR